MNKCGIKDCVKPANGYTRIMMDSKRGVRVYADVPICDQHLNLLEADDWALRPTVLVRNEPTQGR